MRKQLEDEGSYGAKTTPGLWRHNWCSVMFCLIVDDCGVDYVKKNMPNIFQMFSNNTTPFQRTRKVKKSDIDQNWYYVKRT